MIRIHALTISTAGALMALVGAAQAGPTIINYNYFPNEAHRSATSTPAWNGSYGAQASPRALVGPDSARAQVGPPVRKSTVRKKIVP